MHYERACYFTSDLDFSGLHSDLDGDVQPANKL